MAFEIDRIRTKASGPQGIQYALIVIASGEYPNIRCGTMFLNICGVYKYTETANPAGRYSKAYLDSMGLQFMPEYTGNQVQIKTMEKTKIYGHFFTHGSLPPGNRIFR